MKSKAIIDLEHKYGAHNYHPLPVVLEKGEGVFVWDVDGKKYYDCLSAYSAVNQGHCHPDIISALNKQADKLTLTSRAFYNNILGEFEKYATDLFGYDKLLPMNTGAEGVETAIKLCRKWAYEKKNINTESANIIVFDGNFHGRTTTIISFSNDPDARKEFGPYTPGFVNIPYNDLNALREVLKDENVAGFLVEPIQGEAGVFVPDQGYLSEAYNLCKEAGVLFIADEVQTGIARTGKLLAVDHEEVKPDILILGKAISGGVFPVSAVLADDCVMMCIRPGEHGSTFGGNPLAMSVGNAVLDQLLKKNFLKNVTKLSKYFLNQLNKIKNEYPKIIKEIRGKGFLIGIQLNFDQTKFIKSLEKNYLLTIRAAENVIRVLPPLNVKKNEIDLALKIIKKVCKKY